MDTLHPTPEPEAPLTMADVAELIGEPLHSIRNWRRLSPDNPRHIAMTFDDIGRRTITRANLILWLRRNPDLAERVLSLYAPPDLQETLRGLRRPAPSADERDELLAAFGSHYAQPQPDHSQP